MANTRERVKDFPSIVGTIQSDDYIPVDGATQGVRKAQVKDIMDAPITGLDTIANTTKGAINELATTAGKVWVGTQDEYDALPDTKLTDNVLHCITDGEPSAYDSIWDKVGTDPLATTAPDCSGAINELKQSLSHYKDYTVTLSANSYVSPFTHLGTQNINGNLDGHTNYKITSILLLGGNSTQMGTVVYKGAGTSGDYINVYGNAAISMTIRVTYILT